MFLHWNLCTDSTEVLVQKSDVVHEWVAMLGLRITYPATL